MKYRVVMSKQAEQDARAIFEYIAFEKQAPETAAELIYRIEEQILKLDEMPYRFREYESEPWKTRGLRIMPVENFLVCYIPEEDAMTVTVIRIFYSGQNIDKHLAKKQ